MNDVGCVVIAYNEERAIGDTLRSLLAQEGRGFSEIVVVDDGSTDRTTEIVRTVAAADPRVRLRPLGTNAGRGAARAQGIAALDTPLVAMVDADIVLPPHWLTECRAALDGHDAVGGIAVPDGDATYLCRAFGLTPRVRPATTTVTGNNGLYRQAALRAAGVDPELREGEDVALNRSLLDGGYRLATIEHLVVRHNEFKDFRDTRRWLFRSGIGASRQLRRYRTLRVPDLAFVGLVVGLLVAVRAGRGARAARLGVPGYVAAVGFLHLRSRFDLRAASVPTVLRATGHNAVLMAAYFVGRLVGLVH